MVDRMSRSVPLLHANASVTGRALTTWICDTELPPAPVDALVSQISMQQKPQINECEQSQPARKQAPRKYVLERRYIVPPKRLGHDFMATMREWHKYKAYRTEKARDEALRTLANRNDPDYWKWEYRITD